MFHKETIIRVIELNEKDDIYVVRCYTIYR